MAITPTGLWISTQLAEVLVELKAMTILLENIDKRLKPIVAQPIGGVEIVFGVPESGV